MNLPLLALNHLKPVKYPTANLSLLFRHGNFMVKTRSLIIIFVLKIYYLFQYFIFLKNLTSKNKLNIYSTLLKMSITAHRCFAARAEREIEGETDFFRA